MDTQNTVASQTPERTTSREARWQRRLVRASFHRVGTFGLGFACERYCLTEDWPAGRYWTELKTKLYVGPWLIVIGFPITRIRPLPF